MGEHGKLEVMSEATVATNQSGTVNENGTNGVDENIDEAQLTPSKFFAIVKSRKQTITDEELLKVYDNCLELLNKYRITGQVYGMRKLIFHLESIEAEREIVSMGIDTFIYRDDIDEFIDSIAKDTVKLIELEQYVREIPDEIVEVIAKVRNKFDQLYVLYTDYTGKEEKRVAKERRAKDPILFGTFQSESLRVVIDRFYFLGDWEDEYCDLTLDKMVNEFEAKKGRNIARTINTPKDIQELKEQLSTLVPSQDSFRIISSKKSGIFSKIRTFLGGVKK